MPKLVDAEERRNFIAGIAAELIAEEGLEHATVRRIAKRAGATRGLVAYHFENKSDIIELAINEINRRYTARERRLIKNKRGLSALHARLSCLLPLNKQASKEWRMRLRFWGANDKELRAIQQKRVVEAYRIFSECLAEALELHEIPASIDIDATAKRIQAVVVGLSAIAIVESDSIDKRYLKNELDRLIQMIRAGAF